MQAACGAVRIHAIGEVTISRPTNLNRGPLRIPITVTCVSLDRFAQNTAPIYCLPLIVLGLGIPA